MISFCRPIHVAVLALTLGGCVAPAGPTLSEGRAGATTTTSHDGRYQGTGRLLAGTGCPGGNVTFPVSMTVVRGAASMPLQGANRGLFGPVGADGHLDQLKWEGDIGVSGAARGRISESRFELEYIYDWPQAGSVGCRFRYEGRRAA